MEFHIFHHPFNIMCNISKHILLRKTHGVEKVYGYDLKVVWKYSKF